MTTFDMFLIELPNRNWSLNKSNHFLAKVIILLCSSLCWHWVSPQ